MLLSPRGFRMRLVGCLTSQRRSDDFCEIYMKRTTCARKGDNKMETNLTELVFILDKSGSMSGLESDTIGGYNAMLSKQQKEPGEAIVTTVLFDDNYELLHDRINIKGIRPITEKEYFVGGCTALLDLSLIHISEPTRLGMRSYAVFCLIKKKKE